MLLALLPALPAIGSAVMWAAEMILPMLAWELATNGIKKVGARAVGKTAAELAEGVAGKIAGSAAGQAIDKTVAKVAPQKLAGMLQSGALSGKALTGAAGLGAMIGGGMAAEAVAGGLDRVESAMHPQQQTNDAVASMQQRSQAIETLAGYFNGDRELARQFVDNGRIV